MDIKKTKIAYGVMLILICAAVFVPPAFNRDLYGVDELRYAEVVREMSLNHDWLVPRFGGEYYSEKPPVYFWILILSKTIFGGISMFSMALPSILAGILAVLLTHYFGRRLMGPHYAFMAGLILASSIMFFGMAIFLRMDMLLVVFTTAASIAFYRGYRQDDLKNKTRSYYLFYIFMALAILIKGPTGFLMPLVTALAFLITGRKWSEFKRIKILQGVGILLGVVALWAGAIILSGHSDYAYRLFIVQTLGRAVNSFSHKEPFYYYLIQFPGIFLPWTLFLLSSFIFNLVNRKKIGDDDRYLLNWFIAPFILMSLFSGKIAIYLMPIFPPAALLVAKLFQSAAEKKARPAYLWIPSLITLLGLLLIFAAAYKILPEKYGIEARALLAGLIPCILLGLFSLVQLIRRKADATPYLISGMMFLFLTVFSLVMLPPVSAGYSKKPIADEMVRLRRSGVRPMAAYHYTQPESLAVYTGFMIKELSREELILFLDQNPNAVVLTEGKRWREENLAPKKLMKVYEANGDLLLRESK